MSLFQTAAEKWAETVLFYEEIPPAHRQGPMTALVLAVAEAGVYYGVWPVHSHFDLAVFADEILQPFESSLPPPVSLQAVYWREVNKFHLHYFGITGIAYDEKWCELNEAQATLQHLFRIMRAESGGIYEP